MMKKAILFEIFILSVTWISGQDYGTIYRLSSAADQLFGPDAAITLVADTFTFTEGPVWSPEGYLLFSDVPESKIYKVTEEGELSLYIYPSGNTNGLAFLPDGQLIGCQREPRKLALINSDGAHKTYVDNYQGDRFSSPNDLTVHSKGHVYFTDPPWGLKNKFQDGDKEILFSGVFMVNYLTREVLVVDSLLELPNGIALSPDEKFLYVAENKCNEDVGRRFDMPKLWMRYTLDKNGLALSREEFIIAADSIPARSPDGMKVDNLGNLYCTGPGGLHIYNEKGVAIAFVRFQIPPTNCAFGGKNGNILYITARNAVYSLELKTKLKEYL